MTITTKWYFQSGVVNSPQRRAGAILSWITEHANRIFAFPIPSGIPSTFEHRAHYISVKALNYTLYVLHPIGFRKPYFRRCVLVRLGGPTVTPYHAWRPVSTISCTVHQSYRKRISPWRPASPLLTDIGIERHTAAPARHTSARWHSHHAPMFPFFFPLFP